MAVLGALSVTLEVPEVEAGVKFYTDAGMVGTVEGDIARLRCEGQERDTIVLLGGAARKRLHHISLRADDLDGIAAKVGEYGGKVTTAPAGFEDNGLWVEDPHGMLIHLQERAADPELSARDPYEINAPGRVVRTRRSAMLAGSAYPPAKPLRLGHIMVFSPDVPESRPLPDGSARHGAGRPRAGCRRLLLRQEGLRPPRGLRSRSRRASAFTT